MCSDVGASSIQYRETLFVIEKALINCTASWPRRFRPQIGALNSLVSLNGEGRVVGKLCGEKCLYTAKWQSGAGRSIYLYYQRTDDTALCDSVEGFREMEATSLFIITSPRRYQQLSVTRFFRPHTFNGLAAKGFVVNSTKRIIKVSSSKTA